MDDSFIPKKCNCLLPSINLKNDCSLSIKIRTFNIMTPHKTSKHIDVALIYCLS